MKILTNNILRIYFENFNTITLTLFQGIISLHIASLESWSLAYSLFHLLMSMISVAVLFQLWNYLLSYFHQNKSIFLNASFSLIYLALQVYHLTRHESLTFLLLHKNGHDLINLESLGFVVSNISKFGWALAFIALGFIISMQIKYGVFNSIKKIRYSVRNLILLMAVNITLPLIHLPASNEYIKFTASIKQFYYIDDNIFVNNENDFINDEDTFLPYIKKASQKNEVNISRHSNKPNVFVVMLESFSALYVERLENGKPVTPFLDSLLEKGLYLENFFSASVETSKGQFATLCSVYPAYKANVFTSYYNNNYRCLPEILQDNGYETVFLKAYHSLEFENTGKFVKQNGFDHFHGMDSQFITSDERKKYSFGWGIQDNIFYKKTFKLLDTLKEKQKIKKPFFVKTMSVTNHMNFDKIPENQRYIYPQAKERHENYTNSMYLTDLYLREFFAQLEKRKYLKNSIVIITGDNGFPMGQHNNNYHNTRSAYNEMFKMPLLILWPERISPKRVAKRSFSQLDIAPTIIDLLGINTTNHFVGQSVLKEQTENYFVPLIQPFDGGLLSSIRHPYKYIQRQRDGKEYLFNLDNDPDEKINLIDEIKNHELLISLQSDIKKLRRNELLLKENRIYFNNEGKDGVVVRIDTKQLKKDEPLTFRIAGKKLDKYILSVNLKAYDFYEKKIILHQQELNINSNEIPSSLFREGINRLHIKIKSDNSLIFNRTFDVFLEGEHSSLVSNMPIKGTQQWGELHRNLSVRGNEFKVNNIHYSLGLGVHADSSYFIELDKKYNLFRSIIALDDGSQCGDGSSFEVWGDGKQLFKSKLLPYREAKQIEVNVSGVQTMELRTKQGSYWGCDHTAWISAVLHTTL